MAARIWQIIDRVPRVSFGRNLASLEEAVFELRDRLAEADPGAALTCPAYGCCGCGSWMADVATMPTDEYPAGEAYCWRCVSRKRISRYLILDRTSMAPGRRAAWNYFELHAEAEGGDR